MHSCVLNVHISSDLVNAWASHLSKKLVGLPLILVMLIALSVILYSSCCLSSILSFVSYEVRVFAGPFLYDRKGVFSTNTLESDIIILSKAVEFGFYFIQNVILLLPRTSVQCAVQGWLSVNTQEGRLSVCLWIRPLRTQQPAVGLTLNFAGVIWGQS